MKSSPMQSYKNSILHFIIGGTSGAVATAIIQPIDTLKVQIQVASEKEGRKSRSSIPKMINQIHREKGFTILYRGLGSAIWRQIFYASARLGSYNWTVQKFKNKGIHIGMGEKIIISAFSGIFGALIGNPFDVALIRRQVSVSTGKNAYKNTFHAFKSIIETQGFLNLWRGMNITMLRVLLINVGQLAGNDIITSMLNPFFKEKSQILLNLSAILASLTTAFLSLPADNIKVKMQKQTPDGLLYSGVSDCFLKSVQRQGFVRLWVGFPVYLLRGMPHSFVLIRTQQFLKEQLISKQ